MVPSKAFAAVLIARLATLNCVAAASGSCYEECKKFKWFQNQNLNEVISTIMCSQECLGVVLEVDKTPIKKEPIEWDQGKSQVEKTPAGLDLGANVPQGNQKTELLQGGLKTKQVDLDTNVPQGDQKTELILGGLKTKQVDLETKKPDLETKELHLKKIPRRKCICHTEEL